MSVGTMMSGMEGEDDWIINEDLAPCHLGSGHVRRTDRSGALSSLAGPYPDSG